MRFPERLRKISLAIIIFIIAYFIALPYIYEPCAKIWQEKLYDIATGPIILVAYGVLFLAFTIFARKFFGSLTSWLVVMMILGFCATIVLLASLNTPRTKSIDGARVATIAGLRVNLEVFYDASKDRRYPRELSELVPQFISALPHDPKTNESYQYRVSENGQHYVLGIDLGKGLLLNSCRNKHTFPQSMLEKTGDLDGVVLGLQCDDPMYCVSDVP